MSATSFSSFGTVKVFKSHGPAVGKCAQYVRKYFVIKAT